MLSLLADFWSFLRARKKLWLAPLVAMMLLLAVLGFAESAVLPFIYTLF